MESYEEILERMKNKFTELSGSNVNDDSDIGIRMKVLAGEIFSLQNNVNWLKNQMFAQTAVGEQLDYLALERGIYRKSAVNSSGTIKFMREVALDYDLEIPTGTICATNGINSIRVKTIEDTVLRAGELSVAVAAQSEIGGASQNVGIGSIKIMITPPAGITSVTNEVAFVGGIDAESDEELRERLIDSYKNISNGTNSAFYKAHVLKYDGIYSASVVAKERGVGTVVIYVAAKGGVPSDNLVSEIQNEISAIRELNVDVKVNKATTVEISVAVDVTVKTGYSFDEIKAQCNTKITEYFNSLKIGEPFLIAALGSVIYSVPGVENYYILSSVTTDRYITEKQLAVKGSVQISKR